MGAMTNYLEQKLVKHSLAIASFTMPSGVYVALHTGDPGEDATDNTVTGGSYVRKSATFVWNTNKGETDGLLRWDGMPTCTVSHWSIWDASTSGNPLFYGAFDSSRSLVSGDSLEIADAGLYITMD